MFYNGSNSVMNRTNKQMIPFSERKPAKIISAVNLKLKSRHESQNKLLLIAINTKSSAKLLLLNSRKSGQFPITQRIKNKEEKNQTKHKNEGHVMT